MPPKIAYRPPQRTPIKPKVAGATIVPKKPKKGTVEPKRKSTTTIAVKKAVCSIARVFVCVIIT